MSQALHTFIEGDGTMSGDWKRLRRNNVHAGAAIGYSWESNKVDQTEVQNSQWLNSPISSEAALTIDYFQTHAGNHIHLHLAPAEVIYLLFRIELSPLQCSSPPHDAHH